MTIASLEPRTGSPIPGLASSDTPPCEDPLSRWVLGALGVAFLFFAFIQSPGLIVDDTKLPVIMTPLAWMQSALHLWNQTVASGSVQSQSFGYLFPMAPFFELMHLLHVPVWCAERLWLALLLTVGAWGMVRLSEALGIGTRWARVLGAVAYCVAPIVVDWAAISAALLAVVLLPWVLQPLVTGSRTGSPRRAAARSGIAIALMGGVNATVIFSTLPLAVIWLFLRAPGPRRRSLSAWWVVSVGLACFWWVVPTALQGKYGYNYLPYTETAAATTATASAFEAIRGASYWQNYYDLGGPLVPGGWTLVTSSWAIIGSAMAAALGLAGLARRIPERLFLVTSFAFGVVVIAIGYGGDLGGPFSHGIVSLLSGALAPLRNVSKFSPDVALPLAIGLTWVVSNASARGLPARWGRVVTTHRVRLGIGIFAVLAVVLAAAPYWQQQLYPSDGFSSIPAYWSRTADWLNAHQGRQTALLVPGSSFADYTWGKPQDEPLSVLSDTSTTVRSIIPLGSDGNTDMLSAVEQVLASGSPQAGLAPYLARSGIQYVVARNDLNLASTGAIPPAQVHQVLSQTPGLVQVAAFGPYVSAAQAAPTDLRVYDSAASRRLRSVEIYRVLPDSSEVQTFPASTPLVVSGTSGSLLPLAGSVLPRHAAVLASDPHARAAVAAPDSTWVVTDGNQRRATAFGKIDGNLSYLLSAGERVQGEQSTTPLVYGPLGPSDAQTVSMPIGASYVTATSYGSNPLDDVPSEGPAAAFDGDPSTAWVASSGGDSVGQSIVVNFEKPEYIGRIAITPLIDSPQRPSVEEVRIGTQQGAVVRYVPRRGTPEWVTVKPGRTRFLRITILAVHEVETRAVPPLGAGIAEVTIPGVTITPAMRVPTNELAAFAGASHNAAVLSFYDPVVNPNLDFSGPVSTPAPIDRIFTLPSPMTTVLTGTAVPNPGTTLSQLVAAAVDPPDAAVRVSASSWLRALPRFRPENVLDASTTAWIAGVNDPHPTLTVSWKGERSVSSISLGITAQASRPREIDITSPSGSRRVSVPRRGGTVTFAPMTTDSLTIHFLSVVGHVGRLPTESLTVGLPEETPIVLPVGLSSVAIPALGYQLMAPPVASTPVSLPCGSGPPVRIDESTEPTQVSGTIGNLIDLQPMAIEGCSSTPAELTASRHVASFPSGSAFRVTGVLISESGAADSPTSASTTSASATSSTSTQPSGSGGRTVRTLSWAPGRRTVAIGPGPANYLQVAQNFSSGWVATLDGRTLTPVTLDGWEQGWIVPAGGSGTMTMTFVPDGTYRGALVLGALLLLVLLGLALVRRDDDRAPAVGRRRKISVWVLGGLSALVLLCIAGVVVLAFAPLLYAAHRWGARVMAVVAAGSFGLAGIIVAVHPNAYVGLSAGAFGSWTQFWSVVAVGAVLSALVVDEGRPPHGSDDSAYSEQAD